MKLKYFTQILFLFTFSSQGLEVFSLIKNEENILQNDNICPRIGALSGQIMIPEDLNYFKKYSNNIIIRIGGIQYTGAESYSFEFYPDNNGCFSIPKNFVPAGSSFSLYFWDQSGQLNKRILPVYVADVPNYYNVILKTHAYTTALAELFSEDKKQHFENTGMCGYIDGVNPIDISGSQAYLQNNYGKVFTAKYFTADDLPSRELSAMTQSGHFCFFNVNTCSNDEQQCNLESDNYKLNIYLQNGENFNFDLLLSPFSFSDDLLFDLKTSIFRPVNIKELAGGKSMSYLNTPELSLKTSPNYSSVNISNEIKNQLVYFPLGNDLLAINYNLPFEKKGQFFILKTNAELYTKKLLSLQAEYKPGQVYVDKTSPLILKIFNPNFIKDNKEYLNPLMTQDLGGTFLALKLNENFSANNISVFLRDFAGNNYSDFFSIKNKFNNDLMGFFYNIPSGFYQLFVVDNMTQLIIYTTLVQSIPNKTQVVIDEINMDKVLQHAEEVAYDPSMVYIVNSNWNENENYLQSADVNFDFYGNNEILEQIFLNSNNSYLSGSQFGFNNLFNRISIDELCKVNDEKFNQFDTKSPLDFLFTNDQSDS
ncbi:hypothetical protein [Fluviispira sanaruensis]|uniref:Uncharacterized protein n=1 Tax=Fluviispira sanaruensis TaxID=2493639 RepID=A0A4P2VIN4_FLUSA|nr:hypothetical protein [Fluviispira sanaruensis]BBH51734.1 hypothetical protein JCM31447_01510 [Fluviispira sanaruensis]